MHETHSLSEKSKKKRKHKSAALSSQTCLELATNRRQRSTMPRPHFASYHVSADLQSTDSLTANQSFSTSSSPNGFSMHLTTISLASATDCFGPSRITSSCTCTAAPILIILSPPPFARATSPVQRPAHIWRCRSYRSAHIRMPHQGSCRNWRRQQPRLYGGLFT